jgi:hypothetical protein
LETDDVDRIVRFAPRGPCLHERSALFERITPDRFAHLVADYMCESGLRDFSREVNLESTPVPRAARIPASFPEQRKTCEKLTFWRIRCF